jgi:uncharacterized protein
MQNHPIEFVEWNKKNLSGYTLIEGFPGLGLVGTIAAKYLVEKGGFEELGIIESEGFSSIIRVHEGVPVFPSRIYANDKLKLVVLISEQIIPKAMTFRLAKKTVEWIKSKGIKRAISLAGINTGNPKDTAIYGIADSPQAKQLLLQNGIEMIKDGITTGVTALILLELQKEPNIEAMSIMGPVSIGADYKAAAALLEKLNSVLGLNTDVKPLLAEAKQMEKELLAHLEQMKETDETVGQLHDKTTTMYA